MTIRNAPSGGLNLLTTIPRNHATQRITESLELLSSSDSSAPDATSTLASPPFLRLNREKHGLAVRWVRYFVATAVRLAIRCVHHDRNDQAMTILRGVIAIVPHATVARIWLARVALRVCDESAARDAIRPAFVDRISATNPHYRRLAGLYLAMEDGEAATPYLKLAVRLFPKSPLVWMLLADLAARRGDVDEAVTCYRTQADLESTQRTKVTAIWKIAECLAGAGRDDAALAYREILALNPDDPLAYDRLFDCLRIKDPAHPLAAKARELLSSPAVDPSEKAPLHYALAHVYDKHGDQAAAFAHFSRANLLRARRSPRLDRRQLKADVEARCDIFTAATIAALTQHGCPDPFLVCVVGMPRSGTTLVEQILGAHSDVRSLGERCDIQELVSGRLQRELNSKVAYPGCCRALTADVVRRISQLMRARFHRVAGQCVRSVTKLPDDCYDLGLIRILFPNARIIHCIRDPLDTCLSCHMQHFANVYYATDLSDLAFVFRQYQRIMQHWNTVLPESAIFDLQYERLVSDPIPVVRAICDFCDIPFQDNCLAFYRRGAQVRTASRWQVRNPIYRSSIGRAERYREFLGDLLPLVGKAPNVVLAEADTSQCAPTNGADADGS